jgi:hypothetical protein
MISPGRKIISDFSAAGSVLTCFLVDPFAINTVKSFDLDRQKAKDFNRKGAKKIRKGR